MPQIQWGRKSVMEGGGWLPGFFRDEAGRSLLAIVYADREKETEAGRSLLAIVYADREKEEEAGIILKR